MSTIKTLDVKVNGLDPNQKYRFNFSNKGGNWPVRVSPLSGVFYPNTIKTYVYFCSTTGECPESDPNVFYNTPATDLAIPGLDLDHKSLYSVLQLSVSEFDCDEIIYTHPCIVECDECVPKLSIVSDNITLGAADGVSKILNISLNGLIPNQSYTYQFDGAGGSWPIKITPRSGVIKPSESSYSLQGLLEVCPSSGVCPSGHPSVLNYNTIPNSTSLLYSLVSVSVDPVDTFNTNYQASAQSSFAVECDECIPKLTVMSPKSLDFSQGITTDTFDVILGNLVPNKEYSFSIQGTEANWPILIQPSSGTVSSTSNSATLTMRATFCQSTGLCPSGTNGLLPYSIGEANALNLGTLQKQARFRVKITDPCQYGAMDACSNQIGSSTNTYSNETKIVCSNCIPEPHTSIPSEIILSNGNQQTINATISDLIPGAEYRYTVKGLESNWPTIVYPYSGIILASSNIHIQPMTVSFCVSTGMCPNSTSNVIPYTVDSSYAAATNLQTKNTKFRLELDTVTYDFPTTYSNEVMAKCDNCLPSLSVELPKSAELNVSNTYEFDATLYNTVVGQSYKFIFKSVDSNWPAVIYPESGSIVASDTQHILPVKLMFCPSTGVCANGMSNVLNYTSDPSCLLNFGKLSKNVRVKMEVETVGGNTSVVTSNDFSVSCDDCIASLNIQPVISDPDNVSLISNTYSFVSTVSNLIPGETYKFTYKGINSNWPATVYPISGTIKAVSDTFVLPTKVTLCSATGLCPNNTPGVIQYTTNSECLIDNDTKNVNLILEIEPSNCSYPPIYSNQLNMTCDNCIPELFAIIPTSAKLEAGNDFFDINANIGNMSPNRAYFYEFTGVDANWPVLIYPQSGIIKPSSASATIGAKLTFCPSTGICPTGAPHVLNYSLEPDCMIGFGGLDKYIRLLLNVKDVECPSVKTSSNELRLSCADCLNHVHILNTGAPEVTLTANNAPDYNFELNSQLSGLIPGESYKYNINYVDSNWPCVVSRQSGEFLATTHTKTIRTNIGFCLPSGSCLDSNDETILTYKSNKLYDKIDKKFITLNMSLDALDCSVPRVYSNDFTLFCEGCASMNSLNVKFAGYPTVSLSGCACSGTQLASVSVTGAIPGNTYDYLFTSSNNKLSFSPVSGTVTFGPSGSGDIMSIMNLAFNMDDKAVVQMKLKDKSNNIETTDQLAVQCVNNEESCKIISPLYLKFSDSPELTLAGCACSGTKLMSVVITGAIPNNTYNYTFASTSNKITFSPTSGTMVFGTSGSGNIMSIFNLVLASGDQSIVQVKLTDATKNVEAIDYLPIKCSGTC